MVWDSEAVKDPVDAALRFLARGRGRDGLWRDFLLAPGESDEWVTGYVGALVAAIPLGPAEDVARLAWNALAARAHRPSGLWGFNAMTPGDADSTLWGLRLARAAGEGSSPRAVAARESLLRHRRSGGGISTYSEDGPIRRFIGAPPERSFAGWCDEHTCVTGAAAALPELCHAVRGYLCERQSRDGRFRAYWWNDDAYSTAVSAEGLAAAGVPVDRERVLAAAFWAASRLGDGGCAVTDEHPRGSPFATAWCLRALDLAPEHPLLSPIAERARAWLVGAQLADGSWESSAPLRVPATDDLTPWEGRSWRRDGLIETALVLDHRRCFTTATVAYALAGAHRAVR